MKHVLFVSRIALALILLIEAYYKFIDMPAFVAQVQGFGFLPDWLSLPYAYLVGPVEVIVGILLLVGLQTKIAATLSALILFSVLFAFQYLNISTGLYSDVLMGLRGILQDQHLWMILASLFIAVAGPGKYVLEKREAR